MTRMMLLALDAFLGLTAVAGGVGLLAGWITPSVDIGILMAVLWAHWPTPELSGA